MPPQQPQQPSNDQWPITKDDKVQIQELGRELQKFLGNHFKGKESVHVKIVVGAFNYIMDIQSQRTKLVGDDFIIAGKSVAAANLTDKIEEPFTVEPELPEPTVEEKKAALQAEIDALDAAEEVADASPAPSDTPAPAEEAPAPTEAPVAEPAASEAPAAPETPAQPAA